MPQPSLFASPFFWRTGVVSVFAAALISGAVFAAPDVRADSHETPEQTVDDVIEWLETHDANGQPLDPQAINPQVETLTPQVESFSIDEAQADELFGRDKHAPFLRLEDDAHTRK